MTVYWVALFVVAIAFILTLFFRTPPLRAKSAIQEAADNEAELIAKRAADGAGALVEPMANTASVQVAAEPVEAPRPTTRREMREAGLL